MNLKNYDLVIVNSSGGKDSICALWQVCRMADRQSYPRDRIIVSHQDLGDSEWPGTKELVAAQCDLFGLKLYMSKRRTESGKEETLLEYASRRKRWPSSKQRWCTSDFKRGPGARVVTAVTKNLKGANVLYVFGFRKEESPSREKRKAFSKNKKLSTRSRNVYEWLPIHGWSTEKVWRVIKTHSLPYHKAYDLGMPRLSCAFCIMSPFDALVIAGQHNPELLDEYISVEKETGHDFKNGCSLASVKEAIKSGYIPKKIPNWVM